MLPIGQHFKEQQKCSSKSLTNQGLCLIPLCSYWQPKAWPTCVPASLKLNINVSWVHWGVAEVMEWNYPYQNSYSDQLVPSTVTLASSSHYQIYYCALVWR
jgi:hypothetical protein